MILRKKKPCNCGCGTSGYLFADGKIKSHWQRLQPRKIGKRKFIKKITDKKREQNKIDAEVTKKLHEWFLELWDETEDARGYCYCYETNTPMHRSIYRTNTACFHHVLEKGSDKYKKYIFEKWNMIIILPDVHGSIPNKTPRINLLTAELKEKY